MSSHQEKKGAASETCSSNGVPLCRYHHGQAGYRETRQRIEHLIGESTMEWLDMMEQKLFPSFLSLTRQTRTEYLVAREKFLKKLIGTYKKEM